MQPAILPIQILRLGKLVILSVPGGLFSLPLTLPGVWYIGMRNEYEESLFFLISHGIKSIIQFHS